MKKTFKALKFCSIFTLFIMSIIACDKDFSIIESEVLGIENANFSTGALDFPIVAYNKKLEALQVNNLPSNLIGAFKLSIYRNNYFLRDFNPLGGINNNQNYFSQTEALIDPTHNYVSNGTQLIDFDQHIGELIYQEDNFKISSDAIELIDSTGAEPITVFSPPALRISFNKDTEEDQDEIAFWTQTILDQEGSANLSNENNFKNYFRGLYFKVISYI